MTDPELRSFFERYVRDTQPLPLQELFARVGVDYLPEVRTGEMVASFGINMGLQGDRLIFTGVGEVASACGLAVGDVVLAMDQVEVTMATFQQSAAKLEALQADEPFVLTVKRGEETLELTCAKREVERIDRHVLRFDPNATPEQLALREAWLTNRAVAPGTR
jgi:predicted metalloprotease with PDZ domain